MIPPDSNAPSEISGPVSEQERGDFRMTPQRRQVYDVLMSRKDHPNATDVYLQVKEAMPTISLATVYNCLEAMTQCGMVKQVNLDRESSRYCANLTDHAHFFCDECGQISDIAISESERISGAFQMPLGVDVKRYEVTIRGTCERCAPASQTDESLSQ